MKRKIVQIDESRCNGCGECVPNCHEGALQIIKGKATLVKDQYCDGLGACLGHCPQDAIRIVEREAESFDEASVQEHLKESVSQKKDKPLLPGAHGHAGCPSARALDMTQRLKERAVSSFESKPAVASRLANWPLQLTLVPPGAPYLNGSDLLIAADCVAFALADFHEKLLSGKILLIACPKLDETAFYVEKLANIFKANNIRSLTVAHMEVPCCFGLKMLVEDAIARSGKDFKIDDVTVTIEGQIKN